MPDAGMSSMQGLEQLLDVTRRLAAPFDLSSMLGAVTAAARELLQADRCSVWLHDAARGELVLKVASDISDIRLTVGTGLVGACARDRVPINVPDCYADPRFDPAVDKRSGYRTRCSLTLPLIDHEGTLVGVIQAINRAQGVFDAGDERLAEALAAQCAVALQRVRLTAALIDGEKMRQELEVARVVQLSTLPATMPVLPGLDCHGLSLPATQTGGDTFDLAITPQGLLIVLADATGHGIGPALLVTQMHAMLRMALRLGHGLETAVLQLNNLLAETLADDRFVTAFIGLLDPATHELRYLSAGQGPIQHWHAATGRCSQHRPTGFPLGAMPLQAMRPAATMALQPGDALVLLSDGIYEYHDAAGEAFGTERVGACVAAHSSVSMQALAQALLDDVQAFARGAAQEDDITLVLVKREAASACSLQRTIKSLPALFEFSAAFCAQARVDRELHLKLDFVLEELFTNIVKYGGGAAPVGLEMWRVEGGIEALLDDPDGRPFDPSQAPAVNTTAPIEQREPGGLGLHLVRHLVATIAYQYDTDDRHGRIRFRVQPTPEDADAGS